MLEIKSARYGRAEDFSEAPVVVCGKHFVADGSGALYWPGERTLIVADLHLEKGTALAGRGSLVPPYDTRATLVKLGEAILRYEPATVLLLGDSFQDEAAVDRLDRDDLELLCDMQDGRDWIWITGNHDPVIPEELAGAVAPMVTLGGLRFCHRPTPSRITHEVAGHLHPCARLSAQGYTLRRPCLVGNGLRLVLPAFGAYAGGLNVMAAAFEPLFGEGGLKVWVLGQEGVYPVAARQLRPD